MNEISSSSAPASSSSSEPSFTLRILKPVLEAFLKNADTLSLDALDRFRLLAELAAKLEKEQDTNEVLSILVRRVELLEKAVSGLSNFTARVGAREAKMAKDGTG